MWLSCPAYVTTSTCKVAPLHYAMSGSCRFCIVCKIPLLNILWMVGVHNGKCSYMCSGTNAVVKLAKVGNVIAYFHSTCMHAYVKYTDIRGTEWHQQQTMYGNSSSNSHSSSGTLVLLRLVFPMMRVCSFRWGTYCLK
jgi:hypothetical protein